MFSLSIPSPRLPLRRPWGGRRIASRIGDIFHHLWCHKRPPIASGGSGWKDTTGPGCWSAGIFLVDSLKFGTDFRLNHTWKNGRSAFAFLGTGWAIFLGDVCTSSKFFHLSLYREGRTKVQRPYLCLTVTHVRLSKNSKSTGHCVSPRKLATGSHSAHPLGFGEAAAWLFDPARTEVEKGEPSNQDDHPKFTLR